MGGRVRRGGERVHSYYPKDHGNYGYVHVLNYPVWERTVFARLMATLGPNRTYPLDGIWHRFVSLCKGDQDWRLAGYAVGRDQDGAYFPYSDGDLAELLNLSPKAWADARDIFMSRTVGMLVLTEVTLDVASDEVLGGDRQLSLFGSAHPSEAANETPCDEPSEGNDTTRGPPSLSNNGSGASARTTTAPPGVKDLGPDGRLERCLTYVRAGDVDAAARHFVAMLGALLAPEGGYTQADESQWKRVLAAALSLGESAAMQRVRDCHRQAREIAIDGKGNGGLLENPRAVFCSWAQKKQLLEPTRRR